MKKIILLFIATFNFLFAFTQDHTTFETNFENDWTFIEFDPPENNIWQVGTPGKEILDSAYSAPLALMTDTSNMLALPLKHSFIIKFERPWWSNCIQEAIIAFQHRYKFSENKVNGGYIEISYDKGENWTNVVLDSDFQVYTTYGKFYSTNDTMINGTPAFIGSVLTWDEWPTSVSKHFESTYQSAALVYSVWIKFTYENLSESNPHEGWLIDDLYFNVQHWCEYLDAIENIKTSRETICYPNPASNGLTIEYKNSANEELELRVYDFKGNRMGTRYGLCEGQLTIDVKPYPSGHYFYVITNHKDIYYKGKFIKE